MPDEEWEKGNKNWTSFTQENSLGKKVSFDKAIHHHRITARGMNLAIKLRLSEEISATPVWIIDLTLNYFPSASH